MTFRPPTLDEEVYLFLSKNFLDNPLHPYEWWRAWQPWHDSAPSVDFAHPPLHWIIIGFWQKIFGEQIPLLRFLVAFPSMILLLISGISLLKGKHSDLAVLVWLVSPITALAIGSGLMVDLTAVTLTMAGLALWLNDKRAFLAGIFLGLAALTKYPMMLGWLIVAFNVVISKKGRQSLPLWIGLFGIWFFGEGLLYLANGSFHLLDVLKSALSITRGPFDGRALGILARAGIGFAPLLAFIRLKQIPALASAVSVLILLIMVEPQDLGFFGLTFLALSAWAGTLLLTNLNFRKEPTFSFWVVLVFLGVLFTHNYASPRYLLLSAFPLSALLVNMPLNKWRAVIFGSGCLISISICVTDVIYSKSLDQIALNVASNSTRPGRFTGEWAFRYRMEQEGFVYFGYPFQDLGLNEYIVVPESAGPGPIPAGLEVCDIIESESHWPIRLSDPKSQTGYYGETLGIIPIWVRKGPTETVRIFSYNCGQQGL